MPLSTEGANFIITTQTQGGTIAADSLYLGLATSAPSAGSTLASVAEHTTTGGYARKQLTSANLVVTGNNVNAATPVRWGTGITLTSATHWFLCNAASGTSGKLIAYGALSATRSLTTADYLDVDFDWTLSTT